MTLRLQCVSITKWHGTRVSEGRIKWRNRGDEAVKEKCSITRSEGDILVTICKESVVNV
jgi:hypothetical protein